MKTTTQATAAQATPEVMPDSAPALTRALAEIQVALRDALSGDRADAREVLAAARASLSTATAAIDGAVARFDELDGLAAMRL